MKKKILSLALVAMSLVAFNGIAQSQDNTISNPTCKESVCTKWQKDGKKAKKDKDKKGKDGKFAKGNRKAKANPFEGINLNEAQKAQLEQLKAKRQAAREESKKMAKADKQRRDSAAFEARKAAKKEYLEEVKAIIGPDNYVVFLENMVINGPSMQKAHMQKASKDKAYMHSYDKKAGDKKPGKADGRKSFNGKRDNRADRAHKQMNTNATAAASNS